MAIVRSLGKAARRAGMRAGDDLVSLGGIPVRDILDCLYFDGEEKFDAEVVRSGKRRVLHVKKSADEPLGIELEEEAVRLPETREFISLFDVLVDGRFVEELKDIRLKFRGSSNQRVIDVPKSLQTGKVVLYLP